MIAMYMYLKLDSFGLLTVDPVDADGKNRLRDLLSIVTGMYGGLLRYD